MKRLSFEIFLIIALFISTGLSAFAADKVDALNAAKKILSAIQNKDYEIVWDKMTSQYFQSLTNKNAFLANMSIQRQQFTNGKLEFIDISYSNKDQASGIKGEIYAINFLTTYDIGKFYERIVVTKEDDGKFKLSGLWGSPAP